MKKSPLDSLDMDRRIFASEDLADGEGYRLMTGLVIPRPIAWVSTLSADGIANLAPHSFFTVASAEPPIIQFTSVGRKDTLRNIEATGEFTVSLSSRPLLEQMNATAERVDPEADEFELAGLAKEPSELVAPWRVAESPAVLECHLHDVVPVGNSFIVLGRVLAFCVDHTALDADGRPAEQLLDPVGRLSGSRYVSFGQMLSVERP